MRSLDNITSGELRVAVGHRVITELAQSVGRIHPRTLPFLRIGWSDIGLRSYRSKEFPPSWVARLGM
jgi:hypothetical protein